MPSPEEEDLQFTQAVNTLVALMRRRDMPSFVIQLEDRPPDPPDLPVPDTGGLAGIMLKLLGEDPSATAARLRREMQERHAAGASFLVPDGDGMNRIKVGKKFPDNYYVQHDQEAVWLVRRLLSMTQDPVADAVRVRLSCMDGYNREFTSPETAANDARRGFVCIELRACPTTL